MAWTVDEKNAAPSNRSDAGPQGDGDHNQDDGDCDHEVDVTDDDDGEADTNAEINEGRNNPNVGDDKSDDNKGWQITIIIIIILMVHLYGALSLVSEALWFMFYP